MALGTCRIVGTVLRGGSPVSGTYTSTVEAGLSGRRPSDDLLVPANKSGSFTSGALDFNVDRTGPVGTWPIREVKHSVTLTIEGTSYPIGDIWVGPEDTVIDLGPLKFESPLSKPNSSTLPVGPAGDRFRNITIVTIHAVPTLSVFQADLDYYQEWNYTTVTCDDVLGHLEGTSTLPAKPLMITFDDGYNTQYAAGQELNSRGMKGVFYITTGWIDGTVSQGSAGFSEATALTWTQINQLKAWGHDIQSHTVNHQDLTSFTATQVAAEYVTSKARIEAQVTGQIVRHMAYPYGAWNNTVKNALMGAGCKTARIVRCAADGGYPGPNLGRLAFATPLHDRYALPTAATGAVDIWQPNFNHNVGLDEELIPDYGFEAGGKGWTLGSFGSIVTNDKNSGTRSLRMGTQQTSSISATTTRLIPVGPYCRISGSVWIKTLGLPGGSLAKLQYQIVKPDGVTVYQLVDAVTVTGNNGAWTNYTFTYTGDINSGFLKIYAWLSGNATVPAGDAWFDDLSLKRELLASPLALPY